MKIIFYTSRVTDEVIAFHAPDPKWSDEELNEKVETHNKINEQSTVTVVEADKYMEFLYRKATEKATYRKEMLEEICNMLEQARDCVEGLK